MEFVKPFILLAVTTGGAALAGGEAESIDIGFSGDLKRYEEDEDDEDTKVVLLLGEIIVLLNEDGFVFDILFESIGDNEEREL